MSLPPRKTSVVRSPCLKEPTCLAFCSEVSTMEDELLCQRTDSAFSRQVLLMIEGQHWKKEARSMNNWNKNEQPSLSGRRNR